MAPILRRRSIWALRTYRKRDLEYAAEAFRKSVTANPEFARGHRALGETLLYQGKTDEAIAELRRAVELAPDEPIMHESLAKALDAKGLTAEAEAERRRAGKTGPQSTMGTGVGEPAPLKVDRKIFGGIVDTARFSRQWLVSAAASSAGRGSREREAAAKKCRANPARKPNVILITIDTVRARSRGVLRRAGREDSDAGWSGA